MEEPILDEVSLVVLLWFTNSALSIGIGHEQPDADFRSFSNQVDFCELLSMSLRRQRSAIVLFDWLVFILFWSNIASFGTKTDID